jgi:hypothetical protein
MAIEFQSLTLPLPGTYSGRDRPCHYDRPAPLQPVASQNAPRAKMPICPFRRYCRESGARLKRLESVYGASLVVTLSEATASILNRSDQHFRGGELTRNSLRKHLYLANSPANVPGILICKETIDAIQSDRFWPKNSQTRDLLNELKKLVKQAGKNELSFATLEELTALLSPQSHQLLISDHIFPIVRLHSENTYTCRRFGNCESVMSYIGFVDNRLASPDNPLEMALLSPPKHLQDDPSTRIILGSYSRLFGQAEFQSTFYSMCEGWQGGTSCAETCATMALGTLSDQIPVIHGGFDLSLLASSQPNSQHEIDSDSDTGEPSNCLLDHPDLDRSFQIQGLTQEEIHNLLLRIPGVYPTQFTEGVPLKNTIADSVHDRLLARTLLAYLDAKIPLILHVDTNHLRAHYFQEAMPANSSEKGHAVVIIGYRGCLHDLSTISLIVHDPSFGPYQEINLSTCLSIARAIRYKRYDSPTNQVHFNAVSASWLSIHPFEIIDWIHRRIPITTSLDMHVSLRLTTDVRRHGLFPIRMAQSPGILRLDVDDLRVRSSPPYPCPF